MSDAQLAAELIRQGGISVALVVALVCLRILWAKYQRLIDVILEMNAAQRAAMQAMSKELMELRDDIHEQT